MLRKTMCIVVLMIPALVIAQENPALNENLKVLEPFIGTWVGEFQNDQPGQELKDTVTYEVILNGNGVRAVHEVTGGYGGETIYFWNPVTKKIHFSYYTNAGQYSEGTVEMDGETFLFSAFHYGGATSGWSAWAKMVGSDMFKSGAKYFTSGKWGEGHVVDYVRSK